MKKRNKIVTENTNSKDAETNSAETSTTKSDSGSSASSDNNTAQVEDLATSSDEKADAAIAPKADASTQKTQPSKEADSDKLKTTDSKKDQSNSASTKASSAAKDSIAKEPESKSAIVKDNAPHSSNTKNAKPKESPAKESKPKGNKSKDQETVTKQSTSSTSSNKVEPKATAKAAPEKTEPKQSNSSGKLALVISIVALGLVGFQYYQASQSTDNGTQSVDAKIDTIKQEFATSIASAQATANQVKADSDVAIGEVKTTLNDVNANLLKLKSAESQKSDDVSALQNRLTHSIQQVEASGLAQNSRKDWLLAEAEYLLRLANQRVLMENSPIGALALLESADKILQQTDDVSIFSVRKSLAADISALSAVPSIDQEGLYLKIDALSSQINQLKLVPITDKKQLPKIIDEVATETATQVSQNAFAKAWDKASAKLEKLVVISHRDSVIEPLLSPAQQAGLLQNLHILFEQTQLALLQRKATPYQRSIEKAELIINTYFQAKDGTTQGLLKGLQELKDQQISVQIPSIAGSLNSLKAYLKQSAEILKAGAAG